MTGGDRDAAIRLQPLDCQLHAWRRTDAEIHHLTTGRQQSRQHSRSDHRTRRSRVAADKDSPPVEVRSIGFGKLHRQLGGKGLTDDCTNAGDADFQRFHLNFWNLITRKAGCVGLNCTSRHKCSSGFLPRRSTKITNDLNRVFSSAMKRLLIAALAVLMLLPLTDALGQQTIAERLGYPPDAKLLIVHADDLGMAHSVNAATIKAFESGLVSSGSIMAPCPWLSEIAGYARANPQADLGLHLTLTSEWTSFRWGPVTPKDRVTSLLDKDGYFYLLETEAAVHANPKEVELEITSQIERARALGIQPTHLDSHMGTLYQNKALFEVFLRVARAQKLPVRIARTWFARADFLPSTLNPDDVYIDRVLDINPAVSPQDWAKFYSDALRK